MKNDFLQKIQILRSKTGCGIQDCKKALKKTEGDLEQALDLIREEGGRIFDEKSSRITKEGRLEYHETPLSFSIIEMQAETDFVVKNSQFRDLQKQLAHLLSEFKSSSIDNFLQFPFFSENPSKTVDIERQKLISLVRENITIPQIFFYEKNQEHSFGMYSHLDGKVIAAVEISGDPHQKDLAKDIAIHIAAEAPQFLSQKDVPQNILDHEKDLAVRQIPDGKEKKVIEHIIKGKLNIFYERTCLLNQKFIKDESMTIGDLLSQTSKKIGKPLHISWFIRLQVGSVQ